MKILMSVLFLIVSVKVYSQRVSHYDDSYSVCDTLIVKNHQGDVVFKERLVFYEKRDSAVICIDKLSSVLKSVDNIDPRYGYYLVFLKDGKGVKIEVYHMENPGYWTKSRVLNPYYKKTSVPKKNYEIYSNVNGVPVFAVGYKLNEFFDVKENVYVNTFEKHRVFENLDTLDDNPGYIKDIKAVYHYENGGLTFIENLEIND